MSRSFIYLLSVTIILMAAASHSILFDNHFHQQVIQPKVAFPLLNSDPETVSRVIYTNSLGEFTFYRNSQSQWVAESKYDYPVSPKLIGRITTQLADMKLIEKKTRLVERYAQIGLEEPKTKNANSAAIRLENLSGEVLAETILGAQTQYKTALSNKGTFIRSLNQAQTWLASGTVDLPYKPSNWLDRRIINIEPEAIKKMALLRSDSSSFIIARDNPNEKFSALTSRGLIELQEESEKTFTSSVSKLTFDDVFPRNEQEESSIEFEIVIFTFSGLEIKLKLWNSDKIWLVNLISKVDQVAVDGNSKFRSDNLNKRFRGWNFQIAKWKAERFLAMLHAAP